jgi:hypothetical protein
MDTPLLPEGYIRVLAELPKDDLLVEAAKDWLAGRDPTANTKRYVSQNKLLPFEIDPGYGAVPIGAGGGSRDEVAVKDLQPENSDQFLVRAFVKAGADLKNSQAPDDQFLIHSDPGIAGMLTCGTSLAVGNTKDVQQKLRSDDLNRAGYDGARVAIAIVDTGIYVERITKRLGDLEPGTPPHVDAPNSWTPLTVATEPFKHGLGHGTMCAYDALIVAPKATLLDVSMLLARAPGDHSVPGTVGAAIKAYCHLANKWIEWGDLGAARPYDALVVSNSWGIFHPSLEPTTGAIRFIDNPQHAFRRYFVRPLSRAGVDIVFASNNCGPECPSATCLSKTDGMIMGANAYEEILTVGGCDTNNDRVGYSSQGPSIAGMYQNKPDLTSYTHFLGSKIRRIWAPDTGVSAACPVAAGCVAALRTGLPPTTTTSKALFDALKATATQGNGSSTPAGVWNKDYGYGIINPLEAARSLGLSV